MEVSEIEPLDARELERIQSVMTEVVRKSSKRGGVCVYRGEPECYPIVSSGLYRAFSDSANEAFDIGQAEKEIVENARRYTTLTDTDEILTEIQHFGGTTNLVDFTDDYLIALFFASAQAKSKDGRVILHWSESGMLVRPKQTINRIVSQKSVFVRPYRGFIVPDDRDEIVIVPSDLKASVLSFLERFHGISERTVYNDIHGFIRHQDPGRSRYAESFRESLATTPHDSSGELRRLREMQSFRVTMLDMRHAYHQKGMTYRDRKGSEYCTTARVRGIDGTQKSETVYLLELEAGEIVNLFSIAIENEQMQLQDSYCRRGQAHLYEGAADLAIRDFIGALQRNPEMAEAYHGRGNAHKEQGSADAAMADLGKALVLKPNLASALIDRGNAFREGRSLEKAMQDLDAAVLVTSNSSATQPTRVRDARFYRAVARCANEDWKGAQTDFTEAREEGVLVASSFQNAVGSIPRFEAEYGIRVPSILATMLYVP